jgi:hypothetical protein
MRRMLQADTSAIASEEYLLVASLRGMPHCGQYLCLKATRAEQTVHLVTTVTDGFNEKTYATWCERRGLAQISAHDL